jgi:hypothetical protein
MSSQAPAGTGDLRARLAAIERDLEEGRYRPGPWARLLRDLRQEPDGLRTALAGDVSRVSRKLNLRSGRRTIEVTTGLALESVGSLVGAVILAVGVSAGSNLATIVAMLIWVTAFEPPVKVAVGSALGIGYEYVYLRGIEPRFKMSYGSYLAAARWKRIALHAAGMLGSPLGALSVALIAGGSMRVAWLVSWFVFWVVIAGNVVPLIAATFGVRRLGPVRADESSGGSVGIELREALGL